MLTFKIYSQVHVCGNRKISDTMYLKDLEHETATITMCYWYNLAFHKNRNCQTSASCSSLIQTANFPKMIMQLIMTQFCLYFILTKQCHLRLMTRMFHVMSLYFDGPRHTQDLCTSFEVSCQARLIPSNYDARTCLIGIGLHQSLRCLNISCYAPQNCPNLSSKESISLTISAIIGHIKSVCRFFYSNSENQINFC